MLLSWFQPAQGSKVSVCGQIGDVVASARTHGAHMSAIRCRSYYTLYMYLMSSIIVVVYPTYKLISKVVAILYIFDVNMISDVGYACS